MLEEQRSDKPWVLFIRDSGFFSTAMYIERALTRISNLISVHIPELEHKLMRIIPEKLRTYIVSRDFRKSTSDNVKPDMILVCDSIRRKFDFSSFSVPTAYYAIDSHLCFYEHLKIAGAQNYDYLFVAQKDYVEKYKEYGCKSVYWLPPACDPEIHKYYQLPKIYDLCFIGGIPYRDEKEQLPKRKELIPKLQVEFNMFVGRKYLYDLAKVYSQSKIVLNKSARGDMNMRVFEAMSCGSLLLTNRIGNGLEELFKDGKHLVLYSTIEEAIEKSRYYLNKCEDANRIAKNGQIEVHKNHTYLHRAKRVIDIVLK